MRWLVRVLVGALGAAPTVRGVSFPGSIRECPNAEDRQYLASVPTDEPLGLRLGAKLEILEFVPDVQGRSRAVEASALAEMGDRLISVNNITLTGLSFENALYEIGRATVPKQLRFQTHDGRCIGSSSSLTTGDSKAPLGRWREDTLVVSKGIKDSERSFYAVPSADGRPPGCIFHGVIVSNPTHACSPLLVNATDRYVLVPHILGCPMHQKAAFVQEAGAAAAIFIQRQGEKPQQIKVPSEIPTPILIPLVMVSFDTGWKIVDMLAMEAFPSDSSQIRFVFNEECTSEKYSIHPREDPLSRSVVNRIDSASAGFLSLTVAESGSNTLATAAFEFLRPQPTNPVHAIVPLPLGHQPLFLKASAALNACELTPEKQSPKLAYWTSEIESSFVLAELRSGQCSVATQVAFFAANKAIGVIFADSSFPDSASLESTRLAAAQATIPFVVISSDSLSTMLEYGGERQANHILVEFAGENALQHQWADLELLQDVEKWPRSERARERLFYRMLKDQETLRREAHETDLLAKHERRQSLEVSFRRVQGYYQQDQPNPAVCTTSPTEDG